jgi:hypothetical protein
VVLPWSTWAMIATLRRSWRRGPEVAIEAITAFRLPAPPNLQQGRTGIGSSSGAAGRVICNLCRLSATPDFY